ncbi:hypothetical protein Tco_1161514 [Tanacetum coccineum]
MLHTANTRSGLLAVRYIREPTIPLNRVWSPGKCNWVLERQKKLRNQIFRALTASADVPSSVTETTDTTSTLPPPPPPLQKPTGHRDI